MHSKLSLKALNTDIPREVHFFDPLFLNFLMWYEIIGIIIIIIRH